MGVVLPVHCDLVGRCGWSHSSQAELPPSHLVKVPRPGVVVEASWLADACSVAAEAVETIVDDGWMYRIVADDRGGEACRRKADCAHKLLEKRSKPDTQACLPADFDARQTIFRVFLGILLV